MKLVAKKGNPKKLKLKKVRKVEPIARITNGFLCRKCEKLVKGAEAHCPQCCLTFTSVSAFDNHLHVTPTRATRKKTGRMTKRPDGKKVPERELIYTGGDVSCHNPASLTDSNRMERKQRSGARWQDDDAPPRVIWGMPGPDAEAIAKMKGGKK